MLLQDETLVSQEYVPVFRPDVGQIAAAHRAAAPTELIPIVGSSITREGACHCPP